MVPLLRSLDKFVNMRDLREIPVKESILHIDSDCFENTHLHLTTNFKNFKQKNCQKQ